MPVANAPINYQMAPRPLQDKWTYPWGFQTSYSLKQGINTWMGNQLPGMTNFIPGIWQSFRPWSVQRNMQLQGNYQLSRGANGAIQTMSQVDSNNVQKMTGMSWDAGMGGLWQHKEP